jgi:hypothetical protein
MKKLFSQKWPAAVLAPLSFIFFVAAGGSEAANKNFTWSMALQNVRTGELLPFSAPVQSATGERFRILIQPAEACYCYVIAESSGDDSVAVIQAGALKGGEVWLSPELVLSPPRGSESLFIVVSLEEQTALSQRISAFTANSGPIQRRALMTEVFRLRSELSRFQETPEKPVLMGGAARGGGTDRGVEFSGLETYVKTISIEH